MTKYFIQFFHTLIISGFILSFSGCGYKGDPVYIDKNKTKIETTKEVSK